MAVTFEDLKSKEARLRTSLQKAAACASLFVATLLLLTLVPILPPTVSVAAAVLAGVLGYRVPTIGAILMFSLGILGFTYQLGLPLAVVIAASIFFFVISLQTIQPGSVLGVSCGVISAMLMTTQFYFLSLPIMVALPLFRARGRKVGSTSAILVFLALFLLLLVHNAPVPVTGQVSPQPVVLFGRIGVEQKPPLDYVDIDSIFSTLKQAMPLTPGSVDRYLDRLSLYLPIFHSGSRNGILIIVLGLFLGASIAVAFGMLSAMRWLESREVAIKAMPWVSGAAAILGGEAPFLILAASMAGPFSYRPVETASLAGGFFASALVLGGVGSLVEYWLRKRDLMVGYHQEYLSLLPSVQVQVVSLSERVKKTVGECHGIDVVAEDFAVKNAEQDLSFSSEDPEDMSVDVIEEKVSVLRGEAKRLDQATREITAKLRRYCDDSRQKYIEYVAEFSRFGYSMGEPLGELETLPLVSLEYDRLLDTQTKLNALYRQASEKALRYSEDLRRLIRSELDPDLNSIGVEIGRNYFDHNAYADALDTLVGEFSTFDVAVSRYMFVMEEKAASARRELRDVLRNSVLQVMEGMGDSAGVAQYSATISALETTTCPPGQRVRLTDLSQWVEDTRTLAGITVSAIMQMSERLTALEQAIEARCPPGYNWGKDTVVRKETDDIVSECTPVMGWSSVSERLSRTLMAMKVIEEAGVAVRRYARSLEFFINYANIEYLIAEILERRTCLAGVDLPVKQDYAREYLRVFSEYHRQDVVLDESTGSLSKREAAERW